MGRKCGCQHVFFNQAKDTKNVLSSAGYSDIFGATRNVRTIDRKPNGPLALRSVLASICFIFFF